MNRITLILAFFLIPLSCGKRSGSVNDDIILGKVSQETEGVYEARLGPVNTGISGSSVGDFRVRVLGDEVRVRGEMVNTPPGVHRQYIHIGGRCPGPGADLDLDGVISFQESLLITGQALLPLDKDLSSQRAGSSFPIPGPMGRYTYFEIASLSRMLSDLRATDPNPNDFLVKLPFGSELNLAGRSLLIYGFPGDTFLPIACGTITRSGDE